MRKKWDEQTKLQLGRLIRNQLDMQVTLNEAVSRAAEILQAPRSTCMLYWQRELKDIDYTKEPLTLPERKERKPRPALRPPSDEPELDEKTGEQDAAIASLLERLKTSESNLRELHIQAGIMLREHSSLMKELLDKWEERTSSQPKDPKVPLRSPHGVDISELESGDIIRIHHHIWHDFYYISSVEDDLIKGYKLNQKSMLVRRRSKEKVLTKEMLHFVKLIQRNVKWEDVVSD